MKFVVEFEEFALDIIFEIKLLKLNIGFKIHNIFGGCNVAGNFRNRNIKHFSYES